MMLRAIRPLVWLLVAFVLACTALWACQSAEAPPEETVKAFTNALSKDDYPAMARLVIGGKSGYQFSKLRSADHDQYPVISKVEVKVLSTKIEGDSATVTIKWRYYTTGSNSYSSGHDAEPVPLRLVDGKWLIVPYTKTSPTGHYIERLANVLSNPEKEFENLETAFSGTRNIAPAEIKLGRDRSEFFQKVLAVEGPENDYVPYSGYKSMTMIEHTLMFWPVGRADEVIFNMGLEQADYFTCWRKVNGKPKRLWQVKIKALRNMKAPLDGTLARWLAKGKSWPAKTNPAMIEVLKLERAYAAYIEVGAIGSYICWVLRADGTSDPKKSKYGIDNTMQDSYQAHNRGFFVTPEESMLLAQRE